MKVFSCFLNQIKENAKKGNTESESIQQQIEIIEAELQSLKKKKASKEQDIRKTQFELTAKKEQLAVSQQKLASFKCELEMLNFYLSQEQAESNKKTTEPTKNLYLNEDASQNAEKEVDKALLDQFKKLENSVRAPVLDSMAINYTTGFFQQNKMVATSIIVQKLDYTIEQLENMDSYEGYAATFRISKTTNFRTLWSTACHFWGVHDGYYRLMDTNFNDLSGYEDTIENFIRITKETQKTKDIVVYLVHFPKHPKVPHPLTKLSIFS